MRESILTKPWRWLTTAGAARRLQLSTEAIRALVRAGDLACEWTQSGQRIFHPGEVDRLLVRRAAARTRRRAELLAATRPAMVRVGEPRQTRFRIVRRKVT